MTNGLTYFKNLAVFPPQDFQSMFDYFSALCIKGFPANIYLLKVNNRNTKKRCVMCSKLTSKTPEQRQWHILQLVIVFLLLTLNM